MKLIKKPVFACLILSILFASCAGSASPDVEGLTVAEYFQKAYEASDNKNYKLAIAYYKIFQENFPDQVERNIWAEYEIAFTYYKMGNNDRAIELLDALIAKYEEDAAGELPVAPKALADKVKAKIQE
jgi:outer membrane protein assembly factor BamD (BamD/ComL family)